MSNCKLEKILYIIIERFNPKNQLYEIILEAEQRKIGRIIANRFHVFKNSPSKTFGALGPTTVANRFLVSKNDTIEVSSKRKINTDTHISQRSDTGSSTGNFYILHVPRVEFINNDIRFNSTPRGIIASKQGPITIHRTSMTSERDSSVQC